MATYLLSMFHGDGPPPAYVNLEEIMRDVGALNAEMKAKGVWVFSNGLAPSTTATVLRPKDGDFVMTDGPYLEGKEHLGGLCIIQAADLDEALEWGRKLARCVRHLPIEVRPFGGAPGH